MNTKIINIKGMHCRSCEIILEEKIQSIRGVAKAKVDHKKGIAEIKFNGRLDESALEREVSSAGYELGKEDKKHLFSRNIMDYLELLGVAGLALILYAMLKSFGLFEMNIGSGASTSLIGVLIVGLTAGVSTCMALIGGLVLGISSRHAERHPEATTAQKFRPHIYFNLGRIASFIVLGGTMGLLGSALKLSSSVLGMVTIILGFVMAFLGLKLIGIFPRMHNKSISLPKGISKFLGIHREEKEYSHKGSFVTGALTFFVPCGFTQAMQLYAVSTGSFTQGALIMGIFALGTLPGLLGIGGFTSAIKGAFAKHFFRFAGVVVIGLAFFNISNGYNLAGFTFAAGDDSPSPTSDPSRKDIVPPNPSSNGSGSVGGAPNAVSGKQVIEMTQAGNGYSPRQFTVKRGVPVEWRINSTSQFSCAAYIRLPAEGIAQPLKAGMNVIEFTPEKAGPMRFTCSMGMYSGIINVKE